MGVLGASVGGALVGLPGRAFAGAEPAAARVALATAGNYERARVRATMEALFDGLGGLGDIIRPGDRVGLKLNLTGGVWNATNFQGVTGMPPGETFWTHPEVVRAVGQLIRDAGAGEVYVLEANGEDWESFRQFGYVQATEDFGGTFINLNHTAPYGSFATRGTGANAFIYESFTQNGILNELDCVVSLAKSKQHAEAGVTHGMKNLVGSVPISLYNAGQGSRQALHRHTSYDGDRHSNLCRVVLDLNGATPIKLVVNDAVQTVLGGEGPWHALTTARFDTFVASKDPVAADAVATQVMGLDPAAPKGSATFPESLNYLQLAEEIGLGIADLARIDQVHVVPTGVESEPEAPARIGAYPNPFDGELSVEVSMDRSAHATVGIFDVSGRRLTTLSARTLPRGRTVLAWDGRTAAGAPVTAGVYFIVVDTGGRRALHRVVRIR